MEQSLDRPNAALVCHAISSWTIHACLMHLLGCVFKHYPMSEYSIDLLWCIFLKCPGTCFGTYLEPATPESQNIDTSWIYFLVVQTTETALPQYSTSSPFWGGFLECPNGHPYIFFIRSVAWQFEILCIMSSKSWSDCRSVLCWLHLSPRKCDWFQVNYTLATNLRPSLPEFYTSDDPYWYSLRLRQI
jgi:hypothetical protein